MHELTFSFFGVGTIKQRDGSTIELRARRQLALLAYLWVERDLRHSREALQTLLWPDASTDQARNNLRVILSRLRQSVEGKRAEALLAVDRQSVELIPGANGLLLMTIAASPLSGRVASARRG